MQIAGKSIFQIQTAKEGFEVENSASRKRSPIHRRRIILPLAFKNYLIQGLGQVEICETKLINLSCWGWIKGRELQKEGMGHIEVIK